MFDRSRYPQTAAYEARLPGGLEAYTECRMHVQVLSEARSDFPELGRGDGVPRPVAAYLEGHILGDWIPEVVGCSVYLMVRDLVGSDAAFLDWHRRNMDRLYRKPLNRAAMLLLSPTLIIMGAARKWGSFHEGTSIRVEKQAKDEEWNNCIALMTHPEHLFSELMFRQHCVTFATALENAKAVGPEVRYERRRPTETTFLARWRR